jgi:hypothetical protein
MVTERGSHGKQISKRFGENKSEADRKETAAIIVVLPDPQGLEVGSAPRSM